MQDKLRSFMHTGLEKWKGFYPKRGEKAARQNSKILNDKLNGAKKRQAGRATSWQIREKNKGKNCEAGQDTSLQWSLKEQKKKVKSAMEEAYKGRINKNVKSQQMAFLNWNHKTKPTEYGTK